MDIVVNLFDKLSKIKGDQTNPKKDCTIKKIVDNPENYRLIAYIDGEDLKITIEKKERDS